MGVGRGEGPAGVRRPGRREEREERRESVGAVAGVVEIELWKDGLGGWFRGVVR